MQHKVTINHTGRFGFIGDDAADEMRGGVAKGRQQGTQLLFVTETDSLESWTFTFASLWKIKRIIWWVMHIDERYLLIVLILVNWSPCRSLRLRSPSIVHSPSKYAEESSSKRLKDFLHILEEKIFRDFRNFLLNSIQSPKK